MTTINPAARLQQTTVAGAVVSYRESGSGTAMLLIHGIGGSSESWTPQLAGLAKDARLIAPDLPGYGGSELGLRDKPSVDDYVRPLSGLLQQLEPGAGPLHVLGHSLGALIAVRLASLEPERIASLCLIHPVLGFGRMPPEEREAVRVARLKDYDSLGPVEFARSRSRGILAKNVRPEVVAEASRVMQGISPSAYHCAWEMMVAENIFSYTGSVQAPTLIICGAEDPVAPPAAGKELAAAIAGARLVVVDNVGHFVMLEATAELERLYREFRAR